MQSVPRHPRDEERRGGDPAAIPVQVMVLDVPRDFVPDVERGIAGLADAYGIEMVDTAGVTAALADPRLASIDPGHRRTTAAGSEIRRSVLAAAAAPDLGSASRAAEAADRSPFLEGALFGAEDQAVTLRDEILDLARRLPDSRAAVLVVFRHGWRTELDTLLQSNGAAILIERSFEGTGDNGGLPFEGLRGLDGEVDALDR